MFLQTNLLRYSHADAIEAQTRGTFLPDYFKTDSLFTEPFLLIFKQSFMGNELYAVLLKHDKNMT